MKNRLSILFVLFTYTQIKGQINVYKLHDREVYSFEKNLNGKIKSIKETSWEAIKKGNKIIKGEPKTRDPGSDQIYDFEVYYNEKGEKTAFRQIPGTGYGGNPVNWEIKENTAGKEYSITQIDSRTHKIRSKMTYLYDQLGRETKCLWYDSTAKVPRRTETITEFYKNGLPGKMTTESGKWKQEHVYVYDAYGNLTDDRYGNDESYSYRFTFDKNQKITKKEKYYNYEKLMERVVYTYDKNGKVLTEIKYHHENPTIVDIEISYDSLGNKIKLVNYDLEGNTSYAEFTTLKGNQKIAESNLYTGDHEIYQITKKIYDSNDLLVERIYNSVLDSLIERTTYKYDKAGLETERIFTESVYKTKNTVSFKYFFDKQKNLVKTIRFENGKPVQILERTIEYY